jgi:hypothetical protein
VIEPAARLRIEVGGQLLEVREPNAGGFARAAEALQGLVDILWEDGLRESLHVKAEVAARIAQIESAEAGDAEDAAAQAAVVSVLRARLDSPGWFGVGLNPGSLVHFLPKVLGMGGRGVLRLCEALDCLRGEETGWAEKLPLSDVLRLGVAYLRVIPAAELGGFFGRAAAAFRGQAARVGG